MSGPHGPRALFLKVTCGKTSLPRERFMLYLFSWNLLPPGRPATSPEGKAIWNQRVVYFFVIFFLKENKRLQHFSISEDKSKSNCDVIHPGKMKRQIYHFVQNSQVCLFFSPCPRGFYFHVLCTIAMEYLLTWNEFSAFPICLFFPNYSR